VRKYSGDHATKYEADRTSKAKWDAEQKIIESFLDDLPAGSWVLDAPCGTGRFFECYRRKGFVVRFLDKEPDMIVQAGAKLTQEDKTAMVGDVAQWGAIHGDVCETKLPDKSVDAAVNCRISRWLSPGDCQRMLREMQRVSRKRIVWTARTYHSVDATHSRPLSLFEAALEGDWRITRNEPVGEDDAYRVLMAEPC
jgi:ubiquinone/menaquinone biosynthesis C-methylase UbiE